MAEYAIICDGCSAVVFHRYLMKPVAGRDPELFESIKGWRDEQLARHSHAGKFCCGAPRCCEIVNAPDAVRVKITCELCGEATIALFPAATVQSDVLDAEMGHHAAFHPAVPFVARALFKIESNPGEGGWVR